MTRKFKQKRIVFQFMIFIILGAGFSVYAQTSSKFKVGDHVLASPSSMKNDWRHCTITEVHNFVPKPAYSIACEPESKGGSTSSFLVNADWVKTDTAQNNADTPNNDAAENNQTATEQNQQMQFKTGDRVEFDVIMSNNPQNAIYKKGTITEVDAADKSYVVEMDPLPGKLPQPYRIPVRDYGKHWIRPIQGADNAPKISIEKLRTDENNTVLADRPLFDCEHLNRSGKNGAPPSTELAKKFIRCLYEKPSEPGADGARTMDITSLTIGAPHKWRVYEDMGQGNAQTLVYPVQVKWNQKTFYRTRNILQTDNEGAFTCFVDNTNLWQCGHAAGVNKEGKTQEIAVQK